jgi:hypothetical protein
LIEKCFFDLDKAIEMMIESFLGASSNTSRQSSPLILIYGQTQGENSVCKAVVIAVSSFMHSPLIYVTKGKAKSEEQGTIFKPLLQLIFKTMSTWEREGLLLFQMFQLNF